jgi:guanosine-3',5'-bis(diphosphate) 3'-pyrophosphohydrolase
MKFTELTGYTSQYLPKDKLAIIHRAYEYAAEAHEGQLRQSGEPYVEHPLQVAIILAELQMDTSTLAAALLHDVSEDTNISIEQIRRKFGEEIASLVDGATKLEKLTRKVPGGQKGQDSSVSRQQAENLRKMLVAMAQDLRVVFIKLADRLHNMRTLDALSPEKRRRVARETQEIYAPLAHRLGIWELKWQLEDLSFRYLQPDQYRHIAKLITSRRPQRENLIEEVMETLRQEFKKANLKAEITGRPKHIYSIYRKIEKYAAQGKHFDDIQDLMALRVIVETVPDCYSAIGIIHNMWRPIPGAFDDYIANPRPNSYQSLHSAVMFKGITPLEIQARTQSMHHTAEYGVAAHWRYKEGRQEDAHYEEKLGWLRQLVDWQRELSGAEEFLESVKTDIFIDQVFVFTPKGEIKDLPQGSTPLDFAYRIHTDLGHRCVGGKINGRLVPLDYQLQNGDVVEIMTTKRNKGPSRDWLNSSLGFVKTSHAQGKIRQWFKKQERAENTERGKEILEKELKHLGLSKTVDREELAKHFKYDSADEFLAAIGYGGLSTHQIVMKLDAQQEQPQITTEEVAKPLKAPTSSVNVMGVGDMLTNIAQCCHPVPGDKIIGYVTRSKGVTIHRQDCYNVLREEDKERHIKVEWGQTDSFYPVGVQLEAWDRVGLVRDVSTILAEDKINITNMTVIENKKGTTIVRLALGIKGLQQLSRIMTTLEGIKGVTGITRIGDDTMIKS